MINDCDDYLLDAHYAQNVASKMKKNDKISRIQLKCSIKAAESCFSINFKLDFLLLIVISKENALL